MLKSMTAYARSVQDSSIGRVVVEIQTLNRKHLEIQTFLPKEFLKFDAEIKKNISKEVSRGQINVKVSANFENGHSLIVTPNLPLAKQIANAWVQIVEELGCQYHDHDLLSFIAKEEDILLYQEGSQDEELYRQTLISGITEALESLVLMKAKEGEVLRQDIDERIEKIENSIKKIALKAPDATLRYKQRLIERLNEALNQSIENEEKVLREVCIYAEKVDVTEEIIRFDSHIKQVRELLLSDQEAIGKKMEFLIQELNREINTIGSKSSDLEVSQLVVEIKWELERIREQIQNIE